MLILITLMQHCVFILSLFNYGEFIHQALNVCLPRNCVGRLEGRKISATSRLETNNFFEFGFVLNFLCVWVTRLPKMPDSQSLQFPETTLLHTMLSDSKMLLVLFRVLAKQVEVLVWDIVNRKDIWEKEKNHRGKY